MKIIVGDNSTDNKTNNLFSNNKKKIYIGVGVVLAVILGVGIFIAVPKNSVEETSNTYKEASATYKSKGIDYSQEDFAEDKATIDEAYKKAEESSSGNDTTTTAPSIDSNKMSSAYNALEKQNQSVIDGLFSDSSNSSEADNNSDEDNSSGEDNSSSNNQNGIDTTKYTVAELRSSIYKQLKLSSDWIDNHYGIPSDYEEYGVTQEDTLTPVLAFTAQDLYDDFDLVDKYCTTGKTQGEMKYFKLYEYEKMAKIMRYSAWNQETIFSSVSQIDTDFTAYKGWYKAGHPRIGAIYSITVEEYQDEYNGNYCTIKGVISTPDGGYTYYANLIMSSTTTDNLFVIYDIVKE